MKLVYSLAIPFVAAALLENLIKKDGCSSCLDAGVYLLDKCPDKDPEKLAECVCKLDDDYYEDLYDCYKNCADAEAEEQALSPEELRQAVCLAYDFQVPNSSTKSTISQASTTSSSQARTQAAENDDGASTQAADDRNIDASTQATTTSTSDDSNENSGVRLGAGSLVYLLAVALL